MSRHIRVSDEFYKFFESYRKTIAGSEGLERLSQCQASGKLLRERILKKKEKPIYESPFFKI